jgi:hypothetical protein
MRTLHNFKFHCLEISYWGMNHQHTLPLFKLDRALVMAISYLPFHSPLPVLLLHSCGASKASIKLSLILDSPLYSQATSNISTPMAAKTEKISSLCSREVTVLSSGFSTTLELIQALHIALHGAYLAVKKSLSLNIQMVLSPQSTQESL